MPPLLALTTWTVYVCDRLLDARAGRRLPASPALRERHYFHWRHRRLLAPLAAAAGCSAAITVVIFMPPIARERGSVLAVAALAYFSGVHAAPPLPRWPLSLPRLLSKELLVALLFTAGSILPAWLRFHASRTPYSPHWLFWTSAAYFAALAWLNCWCIASWESDNAAGKVRSGQAQRWPFSLRTRRSMNLRAALFLTFAGLLLAFAAFPTNSRFLLLLLAGAASALLLALLDRLRSRITPLALRASADLVLLTPLLLLLR